MKTKLIYFIMSFFLFFTFSFNVCKADDQSEADMLKDFFSDSLFMGDSVLLGYSLYGQSSPKEGSPAIDSYFHCVKSYTLRGALKDSSASLHPIFRGKNANYEYVLNELKPKNIFLFFGINDIASVGVFKSIASYEELINKIRQVCPEINIYVLSTTYMADESQLEYLNNANIAFFNEKIKEKCVQLNAGFIDISFAVSDGCGNLNPDYSSDNYVHLVNSAYKLWDDALIDFAKERL